MATKYHIGRSGAPTSCIAQPGNCPLGGMDEHTYSIEDITTMADGFNSSLVEYEKTGKIGKLPEDVTKSYVIGVRRALRMGLEDEEQKQTNPKSLNKLQQLESKSNQIIEAIDNQDDKAKSKHIKEFNDTVDTIPENVSTNKEFNETIKENYFVSKEELKSLSKDDLNDFGRKWNNLQNNAGQGSMDFMSHQYSVFSTAEDKDSKIYNTIYNNQATRTEKIEALDNLISYGIETHKNKELIDNEVIDKSQFINKEKINSQNIGRAIHLNQKEEYINNLTYDDVHKMDRKFEDYSPRQQRRIKAKLRDLKENIESASQKYKPTIREDKDIQYYKDRDKAISDLNDYSIRLSNSKVLDEYNSIK